MTQFSPSEIDQTIDTYIEMLYGTYFEYKKNWPNSMLVYSKTIKNSPWYNIVLKLNTTKNKAADLIEEIIAFAKKGRIQFSFYLTPATRPKNFSQLLKKRQIKKSFSESWMFLRGRPGLNKINPQIKLVKINNLDGLKQYIKTFYEAYSVPSEVYSGLPPDYGYAYLKAFKSLKLRKKTIRYLAKINNRSAGVGAVYLQPPFAAILEVGTVKDFRQQGVAKAISLRLVNKARQENCSKIFLVTEKGALPEKIYQKIGFVTKFCGDGYFVKTSS